MSRRPVYRNSLTNLYDYIDTAEKADIFLRRKEKVEIATVGCVAPAKLTMERIGDQIIVSLEIQAERKLATKLMVAKT